jgi:integrase
MGITTTRKIPWPGRGYIREVKQGREITRTYIIEKRMGGKRFHVSTRRSDPDDSEAEYQRWEKDPLGYSPAGVEPTAEVEALHMSGALLDDYLLYCAEPDPQEHRVANTKEWLADKRRYLTWWIEELRGVNLRTIDLAKHVYPALKQKSGRAHRVASLKAFFSWLRDVQFGAGKLGTNDARCIDLDLHVPQSMPEQQVARKWFPRSSHDAIVQALRAEWADRQKYNPKRTVCWMADGCEVLSETGWHAMELWKFVARFEGSGAIEVHPAVKLALPDGSEEISTKVLVTKHKGGQWHRTRVTDRVAEIALRLQKNGTFDINKFTNRLALLCEEQDIAPAVTPGTYRHSVATWMYNAGVALADISMFLGHSSPATTKRFYAALGVPINPMLDWHSRRPPVVEQKAA